MKYMDNLRSLGPNIHWFGMIFYAHSKRYINGYILEADKLMKRVGVFVNAEADFVKQMITQYGLDIVQLHGDEDPEYCSQFELSDVEIMKAISIKDTTDVEKTKPFESIVDYYLFDTKGPERGGNGFAFNWNLLQEYRGSKPFMLSGGISNEHVELIRNFDHPMLLGVDINSRFEMEPGLKNASLIQNFADELFR